MLRLVLCWRQGLRLEYFLTSIFANTGSEYGKYSLPTRLQRDEYVPYSLPTRPDSPEY